MIKTLDGKRIHVSIDGDKYALAMTEDGQEWRIFLDSRTGPDDPRSMEVATFSLMPGKAPALARARIGFALVDWDTHGDSKTAQALAHRIFDAAGIPLLRHRTRMHILDSVNDPHELIDRCQAPGLYERIVDAVLAVPGDDVICYVTLQRDNDAVVGAFDRTLAIAGLRGEADAGGHVDRDLLSFLSQTPPRRERCFVFALSVRDMYAQSDAVVARAYAAIPLPGGSQSTVPPATIGGS